MIPAVAPRLGMLPKRNAPLVMALLHRLIPSRNPGRTRFDPVEKSTS